MWRAATTYPIMPAQPGGAISKPARSKRPATTSQTASSSVGAVASPTMIPGGAVASLTPLKKSRRHYPEVLWLICGNDPRLYHQLPVHRDNKHWQVGVEAQLWPQVVKTFDIGVAPLSGPYDQRRSWLKTLEYGLAGVPWIATDGEPYRDHAAFGRLITNSPLTWELAIENTIRDLSQQQLQAEQHIPLFQQWTIDKQIPTYEKVFKQIISEFNLDHVRLPNIHRVATKPVSELTPTSTEAAA